MFGISLSKLVVLALIVAAVWYGYKWFNRPRPAAGKDDGAAARHADGRASHDGADLVACPACGTYVPAGLDKCPSDRTDCPMIAG